MGSVFARISLRHLAAHRLRTVHFTPLYRYPVGAAALAFVGAITLSTAAGYLPGRAAARLRVTDALEYE